MTTPAELFPGPKEASASPERHLANTLVGIRPYFDWEAQYPDFIARATAIRSEWDTDGFEAGETDEVSVSSSIPKPAEANKADMIDITDNTIRQVREIRRFKSQKLADLSYGFNGAASRLFADSDEQTVKTEIYRTLRPTWAVGPLGNAAAQEWTANVVSQWKFYTAMRPLSQEFATRVAADINGDPNKEYDLLKSLMIVEEFAPDRDNIKWLLYSEQSIHGEYNVPGTLFKNLKDGKYNQLIKRELLSGIEVGQTMPGLEKLVKMWRFARLCAPDKTFEDLADLIIAQPDLWHTEATFAFNSYTANIIQRCNDLANQAADTLAANQLLPISANPQADFEAAKSKVITSLIKAPRQQVPGDIQRGILNELFKKRQWQTSQESETAEQATSVKVPAQAEVERRKLHQLRYRVLNSGQTFERDSTEFNEWLNDFLKAFKGNKGLVADLKNTLDWIETEMDMSKDQGDGVRPLNNDIIIEGRPQKVHRIKPSKITGLSIKSTNIMDRHRLIVVMPKGGNYVDILRIIHRDKMESYLRSIGLS